MLTSILCVTGGIVYVLGAVYFFLASAVYGGKNGTGFESFRDLLHGLSFSVLWPGFAVVSMGKHFFSMRWL
jgi:hypothetical protein